jgi:lysophospholipase L1-like esterase
MRRHAFQGGLLAAAAAAASLLATEAGATTIAQNSAWNVTRSGATQTFRVVAYGDSIYAGYTSATTIARRGAPHVAGEYAAALWGQNIEIRRRCQSGAVASQIYNNRINSATDRAFMQTANTRMVTFEMCGNDYLQARSSFVGQTGTCNYNVLTNAGNNCRTFTELAMQNINTNAHPNAKLKVVSNLYYPGYDADNVNTACNDPVTGAPINRRSRFLPLLLESNWMTCDFADQYGWECADSFAEYMAADFDSNGDGEVDSEAIRYRSGESMDDYIDRILALQSTLRDSNFKMLTPSTSADYLQGDNTHPTFIGPTAGTLLTTPGGNVAVHFPTAGPYPDGKNPAWDLNGHDRMGWALTAGYVLTVDAGPDATILECETFESAGSFQDKVFMGPWTVSVDYGEGPIESDVVTDMSFDLEHQYTTVGTYTVEVLVEGSFGVYGTDTATVTVRSAEDAVQDLIDAVNALRASGALKAGQANGLRQPLLMALVKLGHGQDEDAQNMIQDFIDKVAASPLGAAAKQALTDAALRAHAAAGCSVGPVGPPPHGRQGLHYPTASQAAGEDAPEELWEEHEDEYEIDPDLLASLLGSDDDENDE